MTNTTATKDFILALRRAKGQANITTRELSKLTGVSVWTIRALLNAENGKTARPSTIRKLSEWLYKQV